MVAAGKLDEQAAESQYQRYVKWYSQPQVSAHAQLGGAAAKPSGLAGKNLIGDAKPTQGKLEKWVDDTVGEPHRKVVKALGADRSATDVKDAAKGAKDIAKNAYSSKPKDIQSAFLSLAKLTIAVGLSAVTTNDKLSKLEGWTLAAVAGALGEGAPSAATRRARQGSASAFDEGAAEGLAVGKDESHRAKINEALNQHGRGEVLKAIWLQVLDNAKFADGDSPNILAAARGWTW
jgi:hypothetical protein